MISVCMATYNGARFIKEQIDSILPQLGADDELIVSDDGSTDGTLEIIASYGDERIKVLHHINKPDVSKYKYAKGFYLASANFQNALLEAKGEYIFLSDQDDVFSPNKIAVCMEKLEQFDFVQHYFCVIDENATLQLGGCLRKNKFSKNILTNIRRRPFVGCCMAFRRSVLEASLPFPRYLVGHDLWIGLIATNRFSASYICQELLSRRKHSGNVSPATSKSRNSFYFKLSYRLKIYMQLRKHLRERQ